MPSLYRFEEPRDRVSTARKEIDALANLTAEFFHKAPCKIVKQSVGNTILHKIRLTEDLPKKAKALAFSAAEQLRSALDQAAYAAAMSKLPDLTGKVRSQFPIAKSAEEWEKLAKKEGSKDIPTEVMDLIREMHPYKGGNTFFFILNEVRNALHTVYVPVIANIESVHTESGFLANGAQLGPLEWNSKRTEMTFARQQVGAVLEYKIRPSFHTRFENTRFEEPVEPISFLTNCATIVEKTIDAIEATCARAGYTG